jgi:citrate lyase beta subunit
VSTQRRRRSTLFVGALALDALGPALASGADIVCVDLEDAVPPGRKDEARDAVVSRLAGIRVPAGVQLIARVNAMYEPEGPRDLEALVRIDALGGALLPKVNAPGEVAQAASIVEGAGAPKDLYAIIETAEGLEHCAAIARAGVDALFFGGFDLSAALGCAMAWEPLLYARSRVVHAGALGGVEVIDSPYPDLDDPEGLREACAQVKALGMSGKCAKHAAQVPTIRDAFTPTATEVERARRIVELFRRDPTRPLVYEGKLVELPAIRKYERVAQAGSPLSQE